MVVVSILVILSHQEREGEDEGDSPGCCTFLLRDVDAEGGSGLIRRCVDSSTGVTVDDNTRLDGNIVFRVTDGYPGAPGGDEESTEEAQVLLRLGGEIEISLLDFTGVLFWELLDIFDYVHHDEREPDIDVRVDG